MVRFDGLNALSKEVLSPAQQTNTVFTNDRLAHARVERGQEGATHIWPNKSLQPTATAVMPPAAQEIMPAVAVAEH